MGDTPFSSAKQAIAAVARMSQPLDYPRSLIDRTPGQPVNQWAVADARTVLVNDLGLDIDGEDFELLARWATVSDRDDGGDDFELPKSTGRALLEKIGAHLNLTAKDVLHLCDGLVTIDELAIAAQGERQAEQVMRKVGPRAAALREWKRRIAEAMRARKLIPERSMKLMAVGYMVHQYADGHRRAVMVLDWNEDDAHRVITGPDAHLVADAIVAGRRAGPVVAAEYLDPVKVMHANARNELLPRWQTGHFADLVEFDRAIGKSLGVGSRQARKIRRSWGVESTPGCKPTLPPPPTLDSSEWEH